MLDKERLKNGSFFNKAYFENLLVESDFDRHIKKALEGGKEQP